MVITVLFFGILADVAQTGIKAYRDVSSFSDLMNRIYDDFPSIRHYTHRVAVNNEIVNDNVVLKDRDEVALLPPFAGG
jgi:molybdopterin converting factor small subunit